MNSLHQDEILKLENTDLQLQYILGSFDPSNCHLFWACDIRCSISPVENDERLEQVKAFMAKHNISNLTFLRIAITYLNGRFNSYKGDMGNLIPELGGVLKNYGFLPNTSGTFKENDLKERELLGLLRDQDRNESSAVGKLLNNYSLTPTDFMILAKTKVNYKFFLVRGCTKTDLYQELIQILDSHNLFESYEWVQEYRKTLESPNSPQSEEQQPSSFFGKTKKKILKK